jgi:ATP-dependent DNA helicase RecQ
MPAGAPRWHPTPAARFLLLSAALPHVAEPKRSSKQARVSEAVRPSELRRAAKEHFGIERFRPGQRELIGAVLAGRDALGILPTGAGKSLSYQLPALFLKGVVVVVSPLIALMQDQERRLAEAEIEAARLDSTVTEHERADHEHELGRGQHHVVLVTPERLQTPEHLEPLQRRGVGLFVVDEAHCISQWGHDFRPAYGELRHVVQALGRPPILALTATAPAAVAEDIQRSLGMRDAEIIYGGIERPNLELEVFRTVNEEQKKERLLALLAETPGSGILYTSTVRSVNELHGWLATTGERVARYHGRLRAGERREAQARFMAGETRLMIATQAFGLGVDKPDVRFVVHWNFPESLESYYQEAGRAGRDGERARAVLFYRLEDKRLRTFFLAGKHPRAHEALALGRALLRSGGRPATLKQLAAAAELSERRASVIVTVLENMDLVERTRRGLTLRGLHEENELEPLLAAFDAHYEADRERIETMMRYGQTTRCRMQFMREYFDDPVGEACGHCDNCAHPVVPVAATQG